MPYYFDTSAIVPYYCPEALSEIVEKEVRSHTQLHISPLVEVEIASAVGRKVREGELTGKIADRILNEFHEHLRHGPFLSAPISSRQYNLASDLIRSRKTPLRTLDALHLALCLDSEMILVTADRNLASSCEAHNLKYKWLHDQADHHPGGGSIRKSRSKSSPA